MGGFIYFGKVRGCLSKVHRVHAAADIDSDNVGYRLIRDSHCGSDRAARAGVHVRHDADAAAPCELIVAHSADLLNGLLFDHFRVADRCIHFSFNFKHGNLLLTRGFAGLTG